MSLACQPGMVRFWRFLGASLTVLLVAAQVEAASVTLGWNPNAESDLAHYYVGYRTSQSGNETLSPAILPSACVGSPVVCEWTFTTAVPGQTYYFRVYAENTSGLRSAPSTEISTTISTAPIPASGGGLALERGALNYGAVHTSGTTLGSKTPAQRVMVTQTATGSPRAWTAASIGLGSSRLTVTPASGSGTAPLTITLAATTLAAGTYTNTIRVTVGSTATRHPRYDSRLRPGRNYGADRRVRYARQRHGQRLGLAAGHWLGRRRRRASRVSTSTATQSAPSPRARWSPLARPRLSPDRGPTSKTSIRMRR